jgi:hypothetical protein
MLGGKKLEFFGGFKMKHEFNDGGRKFAGYKGTARDCFVRAVAIAGEYDYQQIYDLTNQYGEAERKSKRRKSKSSARTGVYKPTADRILDGLGWEWTATMFIGSGCKVHLKESELPPGRLIVRVSRHYTAVVDGVVQDNHNPDRNGTRCVYGYWRRTP